MVMPWFPPFYENNDSREITTRLIITNGNFKCYHAAIMEKAGVKTRAGLVFWAVKEGLVR